MWEALTSHPRGRLSTRKYLSFATAFIVVCFAYIFIATPAVHAANDAQWAGSDISYSGHTYKGPEKASDAPSLHLPISSVYYIYVDNPAPGAATKKAYVIYFAPGADPGTATTAQYRTYTLGSNGEFSDPSTDQVVTFTKPTDTTTTEKTSEGTSSCQVANVGWLVCGVGGYIANGMDYLYGVLTGFLKTQPLQDGNNALFRAWSVAKDIANLAFIAGFLIIIYSYIVGGGFSAYTIKKIVPRIVIAAVLVNISFWVCAAGVDISNILGQSVQDMFMSLRDQIAGTETNTSVGWGEMTTYVLSGGAIGTIGAIGLVTTAGGTAASAAFLLIGVLISVAFAAFVAVVILAARQALIVILIMAAPLAFVAYLLPNTEKWFEKWRSVFMTMLMLFPIFSVVFGGSQFAGALIIQTAPNLAIMILGMAVQVAPLVITPLLIRFSGGLLGQIAGMTNNRSKGLVDGAKNWAKNNAELHKQRGLGKDLGKARLTRPQTWRAARRTAQSVNRGRMYREGMTQKYQADAENRFGSSRKGEKLHEGKYWTEKDKQQVEKSLERNLNQKIRSTDKLLEREMKVRVTIDEAEASSGRLDAIQHELKAGNSSAFSSQYPSLTELVNRNEEATRDMALTAMRKQSAETEHKSQLTKELLADSAEIDGIKLREYAGGIRGVAGADTVLASAVATSRKEYGDLVAEKTQLMKHFNPNSSERQKLAMGTDITVKKDGVEYIFKANDEYAREAAIEEQLKTGSFGDIMDIINASGAQAVHPVTGQAINPGATYEYRTTISAAVAANSLDNKALFWGAKTIDDISQGKYLNLPGNDRPQAEAIVYNIVKGKVKADKLAVQDAGALKSLFEIINHGELQDILNSGGYTPAEVASFTADFDKVREMARTIVEKPELGRLSSKSALDILDQYKL